MIRKLYEGFKLRYQIFGVNRKIYAVNNRIYHHDGALSEFGYISREFSSKLFLRRGLLEQRRKGLLTQRNKLEKQLSVLN